MRLSLRLARALCNGTRAGVISHDMRLRHADAIDSLEKAALTQASGSTKQGQSEELVRAWQEWRLLQIQPVEAREPREALRAFARMSIFERAPEPTLEYMPIGMDPVIDMMKGWTPSESRQFPLNITGMSPARLSELAFLFGGVGDARHVFGTLIGLSQTFCKLSKTKQAKVHAHFTLLDIHLTILTKDLCLFMLVHDLMNATDPAVKTEIRATIMYTFGAVLMPAYCYESTSSETSASALHKIRHGCPPGCTSLHPPSLLSSRPSSTGPRARNPH